jgi:hypothetical protein
MKFIFADSLDMIDPDYDFLNDRNSSDREMYWGDVYPHQFFKDPPYDGILVSRGVVGDNLFGGKYPEDLMMRFRRLGARSFLRLDEKRFRKMSIFGDCGAFSYVDLERPPYTPGMMLDFYSDGGFTHGCSVDHIIFDFDSQVKELDGGTESARSRFDITLENARAFLKAAKSMPKSFTPIGVVQGWSPDSMAHAAAKLRKMGYEYLAIGGMVPLNSAQIHMCLTAIKSKLSANIKIHLLGFAKAEQIHEFKQYSIASFDSTSPLTRAFKDAKANYYQVRNDGRLEYFTAIRIPQATENPRLKRRAKSAGTDQEALRKMEQDALSALRRFDRDSASMEETVSLLNRYTREFLWDENKTSTVNEAALDRSEVALRRTLQSQPWKKCKCKVCREAGVDAIIFRGSNRNKRRGFHNLHVYYQHLKRWVH